MTLFRIRAAFALTFLCACSIDYAGAASFPSPKEGDFVIKDFQFHNGQTLPEVKMHYVTIGDPSGQPVLVLHGSGGSAQTMLTPAFAGELFGPGQPLDATKYFVIIPDSIGHGKSTKPSDGLKTAFPSYDYDDMVQAQYRLLTEGLGIKHLRLVIGNSMGGMHTWLWGETYPKFMDALVPMASQPTAMAARNWLLRRAMLETIRNDPSYKDGNYTAQPVMMKYAVAAFGFASAGGTLGYQTLAPSTARADKMFDDRINGVLNVDANDFVYQWEASHDYNPFGALYKIEAPVLLINAADDERNPPETGITQDAIKSVRNGKIYLIPASTETRGHATTASAKFYSQQLRDFVNATGKTHAAAK